MSMEKDLNKNKKVIVLSSVALLLILIVGLSFAYFSANISGAESVSTIVADAGSLSIVYADGSGNLTAHNISPDSEPFLTKTFTVTGTNDTTSNLMPYKLSIVVDNNTFSIGALSYTLESTNTDSSGAVVPSILLSKTDPFIAIFGTDTQTIVMGEGYFTPGASKVHTYTLKLYFLDIGLDQSKDMGKQFAAHVLIESSNSMPSAPKKWNTAPSGTLLYALKQNNTLSTPQTPIGRPSLSTEAVMAATKDDYGASYYFRGNVTNNFV